MTGLTPIVIKTEEAPRLYSIIRKRQVHGIDKEVQPKDWLNPADTVRTTEQQEEHAIQLFTDGSKSEHGVGPRIAIFIPSKLEHQLRYTLHNRCSNNQAEQLVIVKILETIEKSHINDNIPRKSTVYIDGNELADKLVKEAARNYDISFDRIPKSEIV